MTGDVGPGRFAVLLAAVMAAGVLASVTGCGSGVTASGPPTVGGTANRAATSPTGVTAGGTVGPTAGPAAGPGPTGPASPPVVPPAGTVTTPTAPAAQTLLPTAPASQPPGVAVTRRLGAPPTLTLLTAPAWSQEPPDTTILHSARSRVPIYTYVQGQPPSTASPLITLDNPTLQGLPLTLAGFGEQAGFYLALLDVRPNNTYGWVRASDVTVSTTPYRIEISQTYHRLLLWNGDDVVGSFAVAVGKPSTPTPNGYFFVNALLKQPDAGGAYGPWIVSSSGFSEVYDTFGGGDAAIGLHGSDEPSLIGQSVSHGCVRMYNADITLMATKVPVGTLFAIHT